MKDHVITSREISLHKTLVNFLGGVPETFKTESPREQVIKEWLLYFEATDFYNAPITDNIIRQETAAVLKRYGTKIKPLGLGPKELREKIKRRLEADRLFTFKKKASALPVSANEIEAEYNQNRIRYGTLSFDDAQSLIRKNKTQEQLQERLDQWFRVLGKKYKVQRFSKVAEPGAGE